MSILNFFIEEVILSIVYELRSIKFVELEILFVKLSNNEFSLKV